ncbi:MAG: hypothetical protein WBN30_07370, partial [Polyangiales bacterium]
MILRYVSLALVAVIIGCSSSDSGNSGSELESRVDALVAQMTLDEKVAQMSGDSGVFLPRGDTVWNVPGVE